jgi:hypothetical protein
VSECGGKKTARRGKEPIRQDLSKRRKRRGLGLEGLDFARVSLVRTPGVEPGTHRSRRWAEFHPAPRRSRREVLDKEGELHFLLAKPRDGCGPTLRPGIETGTGRAVESGRQVNGNASAQTDTDNNMASRTQAVQQALLSGVNLRVRVPLVPPVHVNPRSPSDGLRVRRRRVARLPGISPRDSHRWTSVDLGSRPNVQPDLASSPGTGWAFGIHTLRLKTCVGIGPCGRHPWRSRWSPQ